jgi:acyl-CoA hydrolase
MKSKHEYNHIVFPEDANHMGTIFGGKLVSIIDLAVAQHTMFLLKEEPFCECDDAVTVNFDKVNFHFGAVVGDLLTIQSVVDRIGIKSMTFRFFVHRLVDNRLIADGSTTFVARKNGVAHAHGIPTYKNEAFQFQDGVFKATVKA